MRHFFIFSHAGIFYLMLYTSSVHNEIFQTLINTHATLGVSPIFLRTLRVRHWFPKISNIFRKFIKVFQLTHSLISRTGHGGPPLGGGSKILSDWFTAGRDRRGTVWRPQLRRRGGGGRTWHPRRTGQGLGVHSASLGVSGPPSAWSGAPPQAPPTWGAGARLWKNARLWFNREVNRPTRYFQQNPITNIAR